MSIVLFLLRKEINMCCFSQPYSLHNKNYVMSRLFISHSSMEGVVHVDEEMIRIFDTNPMEIHSVNGPQFIPAQRYNPAPKEPEMDSRI